jgi:hypothetical protein
LGGIRNMGGGKMSGIREVDKGKGVGFANS